MSWRCAIDLAAVGAVSSFAYLAYQGGWLPFTSGAVFLWLAPSAIGSALAGGLARLLNDRLGEARWIVPLLAVGWPFLVGWLAGWRPFYCAGWGRSSERSWSFRWATSPGWSPSPTTRSRAAGVGGRPRYCSAFLADSVCGLPTPLGGVSGGTGNSLAGVAEGVDQLHHRLVAEVPQPQTPTPARWTTPSDPATRFDTHSATPTTKKQRPKLDSSSFGLCGFRGRRPLRGTSV
jgi:hypothetical protein